MNRALNDPFKMEKIYKAAKNIYEGKYPEEFALLELEGNVEGTVSSLKMYFDIFKYMMNAKCYKMGTSKAFTKFLLNHIFRPFLIGFYTDRKSTRRRFSVGRTYLKLYLFHIISRSDAKLF